MTTTAMPSLGTDSVPWSPVKAPLAAQAAK